MENTSFATLEQQERSDLRGRPVGPWSVADRLLEKAAGRMRAEEYYCGRIPLGRLTKS